MSKQNTFTSLWGEKDGSDDDVVVLPSSPPCTSRKTMSFDTSSLKLSSKKSTPWVSSAFDGLDDFDMGLPVTQPPSRSNKAASMSQTQLQTQSRKRPRDISSQKVVCSRNKPVGRCRPKVETDLWSDKYAPKSQTELAVHKKKIQEVESWLTEHLNSQRKLPPLLLLTGPAGVGKTATSTVLAKELSCNIQEWCNPDTGSRYMSDSYKHGWNMDGLPLEQSVGSQSQLSQFQDFLTRANRYQSLQIFGEQNRSSKRIILVEDFPNVFFRDATVFHDVLRKYRKIGRCPVIFIISDNSGGESNERLLFPKTLQEELQIENISFNPIAMTSLTKVLNHVASLEASQGVHSFPIPSKPVIESLAMSSAGDIRGAINALQFACLRDTKDLAPITYSKQKRIVKKQTSSLKSFTSRNTGKNQLPNHTSSVDDSESVMAAIGGRDTTLFLFRALGKILYCKRDDPATRTEIPKLPSHLSHLERDPLQVCPEEVVEKSHLSGEFFNAYLHQNYLEFFSDISDVVQASEYMSDSDYLTVDWVSRSVLQQYAASVATRGLMHSNSMRSRYNSAKSGLGWKPLTKPQCFTTGKLARQNCETARHLFKGYAWTPEVLQTEIMPYISLINITLHDPGQITFLQEICRYTNRSFPVRSEKLDEKDIDEFSSTTQNQSSQSGTRKADVIETEDDLVSNSQSKVKTQMDDEDDYVIEDFDD